MNKTVIKSLFSPLVTEVWELENGINKIIEPTLPNGEYVNGIALYVVEKDFCKQWSCIPSKIVVGNNLNKFIHWFEKTSSFLPYFKFSLILWRWFFQDFKIFAFFYIGDLSHCNIYNMYYAWKMTVKNNFDAKMILWTGFFSINMH